MSNRTPGLQTRSQFHAYWGQYEYDTAGAPPPPFFGRAADIGSQKLPNAPGNPLILPYVGAGGQLEAGDTASTIELVPSNGDRWGLWVCIYPGTAGGGDAVWERCDNDMAAVQTIRDAHVIVVAQDGYLATLSSVASPPNAANNLNLTAAVGDVVSVTCDYLDPGDSSQLEQALLTAAAAGVGIDIRLRPMNIDTSGVVTMPLVLPIDCRLIGAGGLAYVSAITGPDAGDQRILEMGPQTELIDLTIISPAPTAATTGTGKSGVVFTTPALMGQGVLCRVKNCAFELDTSATEPRKTPWMFWDASATAQALDCIFSGQTQSNATVYTDPTTAVVLGNPNFSFGEPTEAIPTQEFEVARCHFVAGGKSGNSWNRLVYVYFVTGNHVGSVHDCVGDAARPLASNFGAIGVEHPALVLGVHNTSTLLPRFDNIRVIVTAADGGEGGDPPHAGFVIGNKTQPMLAQLVAVRECQVVFTGDPQSATQRFGLIVNASSGGQGDGGAIQGGAVVDFQSIGHTIGIDFGTSGPSSFINYIRVSDCGVSNPTSNGGQAGIGIQLSSDGTATMDSIGIQNCAAVNSPALGFGINIDNASISNTIVVGCNLTPGAGTALGDSGTNTEAGHNVLA